MSYHTYIRSGEGGEEAAIYRYVTPDPRYLVHKKKQKTKEAEAKQRGHLENLEVLDRHSIRPHAPRHLFSLEHPARVLALPRRPDVPVV